MALFFLFYREKQMNNIIENLIAPKPELAVGQVWYLCDYDQNGFWLIITDAKFSYEGYVRGMILGEDNFGDKYDVVLKAENYKDILTRDRSTMRVTDGPVLISDLGGFLFCLTESDRVAMLENLNKEIELDEMQQLLVARYLEKLEPYRARVLDQML
jgi:hypothetical protein